MNSIKIECPACSGTGLYSGFMEQKGEAVICARCGGTGAQVLRYNEFTQRKERRGITKVRDGSGYIIDNPNSSSWISYAEFKRKIPG